MYSPLAVSTGKKSGFKYVTNIMYLVMHCTNLCIVAVFILADIYSCEGRCSCDMTSLLGGVVASARGDTVSSC